MDPSADIGTSHMDHSSPLACQDAPTDDLAKGQHKLHNRIEGCFRLSGGLDTLQRREPDLGQ